MPNKLSLLLFTALTACGACSDDKPGEGKTFVLVHGAFMGAAGWGPVAEELRDHGAAVTVVELPAHGQDATPASAASLAAYVARVGQAIDASGKPVILVGHSMGGIVISQVAERRPADIAKLAYVAAYVPANGQSLLDLATTDQASELGKHLLPREDGTLDVATDAFANLFCADCTEAARASLLAGYRAEPGAPLQTKVALGAAFAAVPKIYLRTTRDLVISPALQSQMIATTPMQRTQDLTTSHMPLLSAPTKVAAALLE
jgi:pimeloyl-ACP methyl ester carboxylesterase